MFLNTDLFKTTVVEAPRLITSSILLIDFLTNELSVIMPITCRLKLDFIYEALRLVMNYVPSIIIAVISIVVGFKFISKD